MSIQDSAAQPVTARRPSLLIIMALAMFGGLASQYGMPGSVIALLPIAVLAALVIGAPWRTRKAFPFVAIAALATIPVALEPSTLNLAISWVSLALLALAQLGHGFTSLPQTALHLLTRLIASPLLIIIAHLEARGETASGPQPTAGFDRRQLVLPAVSVVVFGALISVANPIIGRAMSDLSLAPIGNLALSWSPIITIIAFLFVHTILRLTAGVDAVPAEATAPSWHHRYFSPLAVATTLFALNVLFLAQNGLDVSYLWQGVKLPADTTYASYAHHGAGALIVAALAAAALIIVALWPGSASEASRSVRVMVYLWLAQTVMVVASSIARTLSYIDAYGLTLMRLASLMWMGLVALGLILIAARILLARSNLWLVNRNAAAAFMLLLGVGFIDARAIVADYNVESALAKPADHPVPFDKPYLQSLGPSAIPALRRYDAEQLARARAINPDYPAPLIASDAGLSAYLRSQQSDWRRFTLRHMFIGAE